MKKIYCAYADDDIAEMVLGIRDRCIGVNSFIFLNAKTKKYGLLNILKK